MAYTKLEFFENFGEGQGTTPDYGATPRTFEGDLALLTNFEDFHCLRRINAKINALEVEHEITIWLGLKVGAESIATNKLLEESNIENVLPLVAIPCPPFIRELKYFETKEEILSLL